jgi:hypothetical protein
MIALHGQLSCSIRIPACVWFPARVWILAKDKSNSIARTATLRDQRGEALLIEAKNTWIRHFSRRPEICDFLLVSLGNLL